MDRADQGNPRLVLELSATPRLGISNVLVNVSGTELQAEEMIKLPIEIHSFSHSDWKHTLAETQKKLEQLEHATRKLQSSENRYVRPIALIRVQRTGKEQRSRGYVHAEDVRDYLIGNLAVPEARIRVQSSEHKELAREDVLSEQCPVRWILTKDALKEGWDCSFAYVLALLDNTTATTAMTQMVGRIMRQPHARRIEAHRALNQCYIYCYNKDVGKAVEGVKAGLENEGLTGLGDTVHAYGPGDAPKPITVRRRGDESIALSVWSPPYYVGKEYEQDLSFEDWKKLLWEVIRLHVPIVKPGGFLVINIADVLCFKDENMPKIMAENVSRRKIALTRENVVKVQKRHPDWNRYKLAEHFGCSEQTIDRRLNGNNVRGGKYQTQTRVSLVGGFIETAAMNAGLYLYDRRIWVKDAAWENSRWHTISYRSVDESEYLYVFWKPGITKVDRSRLTKQEWVNWGSRGVWEIPSVRSNVDHDSKFPAELPRRVIKLLTEPDEIVLDCFMGSGTTALAALSEGRRYIGIDKEKKSVEIAREAVKSFKTYHKEPEQMDLMIRDLEARYEGT